MRVSPHVHSLWLDFAIELPGGTRIPRFVTSYVIEGGHLAVVDTAVEPAAPQILTYIKSLGRRPEEAERVINTHAHFDHVGGNGVFARRVSPRFGAHPLARPMIEDLDLQERTRPVGGMRRLCAGPVEIDDLLNEGDELDLGGGVTVEIFHTPGHSPGSLSLLVRPDGVLICGDVLPEAGTLPIYESVPQTLDSLEKLRSLEGVNVLLSSMSREVSRGEEVADHLDEGEGYLRRIDRLVREAVGALGGTPPLEEVGRRVFAELGLPEAGLIPIVLRTFAAHLEAEPLD